MDCIIFVASILFPIGALSKKRCSTETAEEATSFFGLAYSIPVLQSFVSAYALLCSALDSYI